MGLFFLCTSTILKEQHHGRRRSKAMRRLQGEIKALQSRRDQSSLDYFQALKIITEQYQNHLLPYEGVHPSNTATIPAFLKKQFRIHLAIAINVAATQSQSIKVQRGANTLIHSLTVEEIGQSDNQRIRFSTAELGKHRENVRNIANRLIFLTAAGTASKALGLGWTSDEDDQQIEQLRGILSSRFKDVLISAVGFFKPHPNSPYRGILSQSSSIHSSAKTVTSKVEAPTPTNAAANHHRNIADPPAHWITDKDRRFCRYTTVETQRTLWDYLQPFLTLKASVHKYALDEVFKAGYFVAFTELFSRIKMHNQRQPNPQVKRDCEQFITLLYSPDLVPFWNDLISNTQIYLGFDRPPLKPHVLAGQTQYMIHPMDQLFAQIPAPQRQNLFDAHQKARSLLSAGHATEALETFQEALANFHGPTAADLKIYRALTTQINTLATATGPTGTALQEIENKMAELRELQSQEMPLAQPYLLWNLHHSKPLKIFYRLEKSLEKIQLNALEPTLHSVQSALIELDSLRETMSITERLFGPFAYINHVRTHLFIGKHLSEHSKRIKAKIPGLSYAPTAETCGATMRLTKYSLPYTEEIADLNLLRLSLDKSSRFHYQLAVAKAQAAKQLDGRGIYNDITTNAMEGRPVTEELILPGDTQPCTSFESFVALTIKMTGLNASDIANAISASLLAGHGPVSSGFDQQEEGVERSCFSVL
jgi:hypothetical protein